MSRLERLEANTEFWMKKPRQGSLLNDTLSKYPKPASSWARGFGFLQIMALVKPQQMMKVALRVGQRHRGLRAASTKYKQGHALSAETLLGNADKTVKEKASVQRRLYLTQLLINTVQFKQVILNS